MNKQLIFFLLCVCLLLSPSVFANSEVSVQKTVYTKNLDVILFFKGRKNYKKNLSIFMFFLIPAMNCFLNIIH